MEYADEAMVEMEDGTRLPRVSSKTDPCNHTTTFEYSTLNKTTFIIDPEKNVTTHRSDSSERLVQEVDTLGASVIYNYGTDGMGRTVRDKNGNITNYQMRKKGGESTGDVYCVTDAAGNTTRYEYNDNDLVTKVTGPRGGETLYEYDDGDEPAHPYDLTRKTDPEGFVTTYTYGYSIEGNRGPP